MKQAHRGSILHFLSDPDSAEAQCYEYFLDGLMVVEDGVIRSLEDASQGLENLDANIQLIEHKDSLIMPGFVDTHIHFPQTEVIAAYGEQLLQWLNKYTFQQRVSLKTKTMPEPLLSSF